MKYLVKRLPLTSLLALALTLVWPKIHADECKVGCENEVYQEAGQENNYDLFMDKPADDFKYSDKVKHTERDQALGRERRSHAKRHTQRENKREERRRKREEKKENRAEKHSNKKQVKKESKREVQNKKHTKHESRKKVTRHEKAAPKSKREIKEEKKHEKREKKKPSRKEKAVKKPTAVLAEDIARNKEIVEGIYAGITGFERLKPGEHEDIVARGGFPTYGEITYDSWQAILNDLQNERGLPGPKDIFMDFGMGVGKTPMQTYLNTPVAAARGVDLAKTRYKRAVEARDRLEEMGLLEKGRSLEYEWGSMLEVNLKGVTIGYTCSTCFSHDLMHGLMEMLSKQKKGFIFLTLKELPDDYADYGFKLVKVYQLPMTWAKDVPVHMYELVGKPKKSTRRTKR